VNGQGRLRAVGLLLAVAWVYAAAAGDSEEQGASQISATAAAAAREVARAAVDRPKPVFELAQRNPRIYRLPAFQELVDAAPPDSELIPPPGAYRGPVRLDKPLRIDGRGKVTIDAGDRGTVITLATDNATIRGLHLTGSGESHDTDDSCLDVRGSGNVIENLEIDNCLFGIDLKQAHRNILRGNRIRSKPMDLGVRGDAIRLWSSNDNLVENNHIDQSRDTVAWYSSRNTFRGNEGRRSRYSLHFMFANDNVVEDNRFFDNAVGVYLMYTERIAVRRNVISHATGAAGMGLGFKESSDADIEGNDIVYCAVAVGSDISPFQPDTTIRFRNNRIAYNGIGFQFTSELGGNVATGNIFEGNLINVVQSGRGKALLNKWHGNYWDDYDGFDLKHEGTGSTPYESYAYTDLIWIETPEARFFRNSPVMELLDFLERLAPFSAPELQVRDDAPLFAKPGSGS